MQPGVEIIFFISGKTLDEKFVYKLVEPLISMGSKYKEPPEKLRGTKGFPATLEDQIRDVLSSDNRCRWIDFIYKGIYYELLLYPDNPFRYRESKLGEVRIWVPESALNPRWHEDELGEKEAFKRCVENANSLIEVAKTVWNALEPKPIYGVGDDALDDPIPFHVFGPSEENILNLKVEPYVFWLNFYGPELVKKFGKEKLLSMPAYRVEELDDGILFLESPLPPFYIRKYRRETCKKIRDHFGWKVYDLDVFDPERLVVKERGAYEKEFRYMSILKEYMEIEIEEFRSRGYRIFVFLEVPSTKPIPEHVKEIENWLRGKGVNVKIVRW